MKRHFTLFHVFVLYWATNAVAQSYDYRFQHLQVDQGLTHNEVTCFFKDETGFLWIGTTAGLNRFDGYTVRTFVNDPRDSTSISDSYIKLITSFPGGKLGIITPTGFNIYDPKTERFQKSSSKILGSYGLPDETLSDIIRDRSQNFWTIYRAGGVYRYSLKNGNALQIKHRDSDPKTIATDSVTGFAETQNKYWIIHSNGIFEQISLEGRVLYRNDFLHQQNKGVNLDYRIYGDSEGNLWMYAANGTAGVYCYHVSTNRFRHGYQGSPDIKLNNNIVRSLLEDNRGQIWIATDHGGINVFNKENNTVRYILHRDDDDKSLGQNSINVLYKDRDGIIWVGTYKKGLSYFHENLIRFKLYKNSPADPTSIPFSDVNRFVEDDDGNFWIGTNGGGLIYFNRKHNTFTQYKNNPNDPNSLSNNVIVSLLIDSDKKLWIGTYYGGLNCFDGKKFKRYQHKVGDEKSLPDNNIWELFEDSRAQLWIGTLSEGLVLFDRKKETFTQFKPGDTNSIHDNYVSALHEDKAGNLWIGTARGIDVLMRQTGRFIHYKANPKDSTSLSDNGVLDIFEDSREQIWIATKSGLNYFDNARKTFTVLTTDDGLPSNTVLTVREDNYGDLWMSTPSGISHLVIGKNNAEKQFTFYNYDEADGLQGKQFNENAACKTDLGELIFGGANGFNIFKPEQLGKNLREPDVVISEFQLFQQRVRPGEQIDGKPLLPTSISVTKEITLPYDKNFFTFEIAALNFFHPEKNQYLYTLEGLNGGWLKADNKSRKLTFTNLDPGHYVLKVKAANNDGVWSHEKTVLNIHILPPFWKTRMAFLIYFILLLLALFITRKLIQQRERMKFAIKQERQEAIRMHELDMMKIKFFTNVSHEFRTPLTLILTPIEKILRQTTDVDHQNQFRLIQRNAKRLLNLVNQLLDFRKMEVQEIRFNPSEGDIIQFIRETAGSFSDLSEKKNIAFNIDTDLPSLETVFDQDKLEKILFNLLSNAFKFTRETGKVQVHVSLDDAAKEKWLIISVTDSGIGIPADKLDKIFDRFFQNELPKSIVNQGSGIGLSITKEFVRIHGGTITVESDVDRGSTFTVRLPITEVFEQTNISKVNEVEIQETLTAPFANQESDVAATHKPTILLVEDNEDFRFYLKDNLKFEFKIIDAANGLIGWQQTLQQLPDLIVSDVMMPEMNGMELCKKIKQDQRVSHIPVILLTARTEEEQKLEGLQTGADDYITKPFSFEILISRIRNLITQRENFHKAFPLHHEVRASELNITSLDSKFIENAIKYVEENVGNADFSVEDLSRQMGISRANFYKKILSLTGKSPLEFIRTIRLQHAAQLLEKSQLTVSEVAYAVGFNNPKYFARYFKEAYHELPSSYAARKRKASSS
ncbi:hybrid sensor histidine kinase/response regulator transcription factor [Pseudochryseolinea flava]|uniref:histidine kinase n=1 Tax=Pseudochryseolinea flava TaxID=2059302 RepID=A0A364Y088_9BACT|nr:hybrid sensor histidine kinase/response regulator transcription factor [Pseudochryseolinea flava]RAV99479.1 hybrid sensor histidine kinase/response regulator [Pseudochryseolinea flava]